MTFTVYMSHWKEMSFAWQCWPFVTFFVNCSNLVEPGLSGFEQLINFVSSSWFPAKSVDQLIVAQSNFEQLIPTLKYHYFYCQYLMNSDKRTLSKIFFWQKQLNTLNLKDFEKEVKMKKKNEKWKEMLNWKMSHRRKPQLKFIIFFFPFPTFSKKKFFRFKLK